MAKIPEKFSKLSIIPSLAKYLHHQGKVRETYINPLDKEELIQVASNRLSAFDFVFPVIIPDKGAVLTALTDFFWRTILQDIPNHFLESSRFPGRNKAKDLKEKLPDLPLDRTLVVIRAIASAYELIFRRHPGGSIWKEYCRKGTAGGHPLPPGLSKWQALPSALFTPSRKAADGHDENITAQLYFKETGEDGRRCEYLTRQVYDRAYAHCKPLGLLILDTKEEVGYPRNRPGEYMIIDEVLTADSSRFALEADLERALSLGEDPAFYDKQVFRDWASKIVTPFSYDKGGRIEGINNLEPLNPEHVAYVYSLNVPQDVIEETRHRYLQLPKFITGMPLEEYQATYLL